MSILCIAGVLLLLTKLKSFLIPFFSVCVSDPVLNVYYEHGGSDMTLLFTSQSSSPDWQKLILPLGRISSIFNFVIEAISSGMDGETISIDEVKLTNCHSPSPCVELPPSYLECENKVCYPEEAKCDFTDDCGDYSDEALCGEWDRLLF